MLTGSGGTGPDGEPTAFALLCGPKGLKIDMSTTGVTKAYQIDNLLMVITDGVVTFTLLSGSGIVTEV